MIPVVNRLERLFVPRNRREYVGDGVNNPNVIVMTPANRDGVIRDIAAMSNGVRMLEGSVSVGKSTYFCYHLSKNVGGLTVVLTPTSILASSSAYSIDKCYEADYAGAYTTISPHLDVSGKLVYVDAEAFSYQLMTGMRLSDAVSMVVVDESHLNTGEYAALKKYLLTWAKEFPVVMMTGTTTGRTATYDTSKVREIQIAEVPKDANVLYYCKSASDARERSKAESGICLSKFMTYTQVKSIYETLELKGQKLFADANLSEGLNFPIDVVVDCNMKHQLQIHEGQPEYSVVNVSVQEHVQRVARLRNRGMYCGEPLSRLKAQTAANSFDEYERAMEDFILTQLGLPVVSKPVVNAMVAYIKANLTVQKYGEALAQAVPWYELQSPPKYESALVSSPRLKPVTVKSNSFAYLDAVVVLKEKKVPYHSHDVQYIGRCLHANYYPNYTSLTEEHIAAIVHVRNGLVGELATYRNNPSEVGYDEALCKRLLLLRKYVLVKKIRDFLKYAHALTYVYWDYALGKGGVSQFIEFPVAEECVRLGELDIYSTYFVVK